MLRKKYFAIALFFILASCQMIFWETISVYGTLGISKNILTARKQPMKQNGDFLVIDITDKKNTLSNLIECDKLLITEIDVIYQNILNRYTLKDRYGVPYKRKFVATDKNGNVKILKDFSEFKYVWDPDNPHACKEGKWKGYVAFPNIDIIEETFNLKLAISEYNTVAKIIEKIDSSIIMPDLSNIILLYENPYQSHKNK